jgi:hypothetical protein
MKLGQAERRKDRRVETELPVFLGNARGVTRDMSPSGAFFWISGRYAVGESVSFSMEMKTAGGTMMWKCRGNVVRTEPRGDDIGVAVRITESAMERAAA